MLSTDTLSKPTQEFRKNGIKVFIDMYMKNLLINLRESREYTYWSIVRS